MHSLSPWIASAAAPHHMSVAQGWGAQAVGADAGAHRVLQPWAPHKVVLADVQVAHRRARQRSLHPKQPISER